MSSVDGVRVPEELRCTREHIWVRVEDGALVAGVTDYARQQLGEVAFVDLPTEERDLAAGEEFGTIESVKSVNDLYTPVAGRVIACNRALEDGPGLVNDDCYGEGWLIRLQPEDMAAVDGLLSAGEYLDWLKTL